MAAHGSAPRIATASKVDSEVIIGAGEFTYRVHHHWPQLPDKYSWQTTHNVAVDKAGNLYVIHEGLEKQSDHPAIFVFDEQGQFVRAFGQQFQGGGHGIEVHEEGGEEFLYIAAYQQVKCLAKLTLTGEVVWQQFAPMASDKYAAGEAEHPQRAWGRDHFLPTNFAFLPDGGFLLADGYGSYFIHRYDAAGQWQSCFGGPGKGQGTFDTPHGIWIDARGAEPIIIVADRAHHTLQRLSLSGDYIDTIDGFGLPANVDICGDLMLVPELVARVTILDKDNQVVARLGEDVARISADRRRQIRETPADWQAGKFVHPHDACFAADGSIYVAEWVKTGRITKLEKV
ncbi:NHL repeat protein [Aureliella helgolandensis]|uniref:NHL repeat protein n=2 Tax=Aureliella helgolandensis TaxID=2527968 RepID=A0A518GEH0_9BACT|nr:NHL repeat protein [Aureliella helgolandensis]